MRWAVVFAPFSRWGNHGANGLRSTRDPRRHPGSRTGLSPSVLSCGVTHCISSLCRKRRHRSAWSSGCGAEPQPESQDWSFVVECFAQPLWCHPIVWHCLVVSLHLTPQGLLSEVSGIAQAQWGNWEIGGGVWWLGVGAGWGESAFLVRDYFPIEFKPGHGDFRLTFVLEARTWLAGV